MLSVSSSAGEGRLDDRLATWPSWTGHADDVLGQVGSTPPRRLPEASQCCASLKRTSRRRRQPAKTAQLSARVSPGSNASRRPTFLPIRSPSPAREVNAPARPLPSDSQGGRPPAATRPAPSPRQPGGNGGPSLHIPL
ncbi:hypothetical protein CDD83_1793 [Cordyceps sp. RAO-2017]|nr:hypothetical protein CDD83_1793 [Cordyceps sp. RAO-2017]